MANARERLDAAMTSLAQGDRAALSTVYEMTSAKLFGTIVRIVRSRERSEDLLQDVYVKVWRKAATFDRAKGAPITWLCTIARNTALNDVRRVSRNSEISSEVMPEVEDSDIQPSDDWLCSQEDSLALRKCLDELQPDHRRSIVLTYFEGYTQSEMATRTNTPLGTIKSWINRGLTGLKGCLDG